MGSAGLSNQGQETPNKYMLKNKMEIVTGQTEDTSTTGENLPQITPRKRLYWKFRAYPQAFLLMTHLIKRFKMTLSHSRNSIRLGGLSPEKRTRFGMQNLMRSRKLLRKESGKGLPT